MNHTTDDRIRALLHALSDLQLSGIKVEATLTSQYGSETTIPNKLLPDLQMTMGLDPIDELTTIIMEELDL